MSSGAGLNFMLCRIAPANTPLCYKYFRALHLGIVVISVSLQIFRGSAAFNIKTQC